LWQSIPVVVALVLGAGSAFAGTTLHLRAGAVDTQSEAQNFSPAEAARKKSAAYYVVQFKSVIRTEDRRNLLTLGARIVRYIPDDALVVRATSHVALTIGRSSAAVAAVVPYRADWKTAPEFIQASVFTRSNRELVLVQLFPGEKADQLIAKVQALKGARLVSTSSRFFIAEISRAQVAEVALFEGVEWVQPAPQIETLEVKGMLDSRANADEPNGDYSDLKGYENGFRLIKGEETHGRGISGRGQVVSVADSGLDIGDIGKMHTDFAARVPVGYAFGLFAKSWEDPMGHGTHVAGSVASNGAASGGKLKGGAFEATLIPEGMWSPMLDNLTVPPKLADLFSKAYEKGARIHTNSWGSPQNLGIYDGMASQVDEYMAANPEMLILFAAGNSGVDKDKDGRVDPGSVTTPSTAKNCLSVGASKNFILHGGLQVMLKETRLKDSFPAEPLASSRMSENPAGLAAFSSRGPTADGRMKPDVVAPGTNILSVRSQHPKSEKLWGLYNKDYAWAGGTSMATPITAGAAAMLRQYLAENLSITQPSAALMKAIFMHTASDMFPGQFGEVGKEKGQELLNHRPNHDQGYGRIDLAKATDLGGAILVDEKKGLATGEGHTYSIRVGSQAKLTATLVYTDAAGSAAAAKALVNDLDLILVDPKGGETSLGDHLNNAEMIEATVAPGDYTIRVVGGSVPQGPADGKQPYAIVLSVN
jgi:subtilisin family serine protease